ncbi:MAG: MBL fold metallo-hydrolase [Caldiserica bacterium]|nr:MBL fold metallo-hydrolase [Caldisericota bacterium]
MKRKRLFGNLYLICQEGEKNCNIYAIGEAETILIDCGIPEIMETITNHLSSFCLPFPSYVLITHCHFDHSLAAPDFKEKGSKIVAHYKTAEALEKDTYKIWPENLPAVKAVKVDIKVKKDCLINLSGYQVKLLHTPGHTAGSSCFMAEISGRKCLFTSDLFLPSGKIGWKGSIDFNLAEFGESLRKIRALDFDILLPGHGDMLEKEEGRECIERAIENLKNPL